MRDGQQKQGPCHAMPHPVSGDNTALSLTLICWCQAASISNKAIAKKSFCGGFTFFLETGNLIKISHLVQHFCRMHNLFILSSKIPHSREVYLFISNFKTALPLSKVADLCTFWVEYSSIVSVPQ